MSEALNLTRSYRLGKKYTFENKRTFGLLVLAETAFLGLWMGVYLTFKNPYLFSENFQVAFYFTGLFLFGCLSGGTLFSELGSKPKAINYLMTPVSTLEKFLCILLFGVAFFIVEYTLVFSIIDTIAVSLANRINDTHMSVINPFDVDKYKNTLYDGPFSLMYYAFFAVQSFFILMSVHFPKHSILKSLIGLGLLWVAFILMMVVTGYFLPKGIFSRGLESYEVLEPSGRISVINIPAAFRTGFIVFLKYVLTPLLWIASYWKLKERQL